MPPPDIAVKLREFTNYFSTEEACASYLVAARWPAGLVCPRCGTAKGYRIKGRHIRVPETGGARCVRPNAAGDMMAAETTCGNQISM